MKILAVETSGFEGSIALSEDRQIVEERFLPTEGRRHAQTLVLEIDQLLSSHGLHPSDIDAVAVSAGPGSFTGLRVGIVFAKTFAWANSCALLAVDTLRAFAQQIDSSVQTVTVISDAQRREIFVNDYEWNGNTASRVASGEIRIESVDSMANRAGDDQSIMTGPGLKKFSTELAGTYSFANPDCWLPRAATIAELGSVMLAADQLADLRSLEPVYIRRSYAEEKPRRG